MYCLDSQNGIFYLKPTVQLLVNNFLKQYIDQYTEAEWAEVFQQFFNFQNPKRPFNPTTNLWILDLIDNL